MNRKKFLAVLISSLSVLLLLGVCLITSQVNDNNPANEFIHVYNSQDNGNSTIAKSSTDDKQGQVNSNIQLSSKKNNSIANNENIKINKDDTFYTGPEEGDTVDAHEFEINYSTPNDITYTNVYYGLKDGKLTIGPEETEATPNQDSQVVGSTPGWYKDIYSVFEVEIIGSITPVCTKSWFSTACEPGDFHKPRIKSIKGIENLNMSGITDASYMFCGIGLKWACTIEDISSWSVEDRTLSSLTNAEGMFSNCQSNSLMSALCNTSLDEAKGPQIKPEKTTYMFIKSSLASLNMGNWALSNCNDLSYMFNGCLSLTSITNIPVLNLQGKNLRSMFNTTGLTSLDLTKWSTTCSNDTNMTNTFRGNTSLATIKVAEGTDWSNCKDEYYDASNPNSGSMFYASPLLTGCNGTNYNTEKVNGPKYARVDLGYDYHEESNGITTTPGYFTAKTPKAVSSTSSNDNTLTFVYDDSKTNRNAYVATGVKPYNASTVPWTLNNLHKSITTVKFGSTYSDCAPEYVDHWFDGFSELVSIGETNNVVTNFNTSACVSMSYLFCNCFKLPKIDLTNLDTGKVLSMSRMFFMDRGNPYDSIDNELASISFFGGTKVITSQCLDFSFMFYNCRHVSTYGTIPANTFDSATTIQQIFDCNRELKSINSNIEGTFNFSSFDLTNVTSASYALASCTEYFNKFISPTKKLTKTGVNLTGLFGYDHKITSIDDIDLTGLNIADNHQITDEMFISCTGLTLTNVPEDFNILGPKFFKNCSGLTVVNLPLTVTELGTNCFEGCANLAYVRLGNNSATVTTKIGDGCFKDCKKLRAYVVQAEGTKDATTYGTKPFEGAGGGTDGTKSHYAPLAIAGRSTTAGAGAADTTGHAASRVTKYTFKAQAGKTGATSELAFSTANTYIQFQGTYSFNSTTASVRVNVNAANICIDLNGKTIDRGLKGKSAISEGSALYCNTSANYFRLDDSSTVNIESNNIGTITGARSTSDYGGGLKAGGDPGIIVDFVNGRINDNEALQGGGIMVMHKCTLNMYGGKISSNKATQSFHTDGRSYGGGGIMNKTNGIVHIYGGRICENTATSMGGGIFLYAKTDGFLMTGGEIDHNTAGTSFANANYNHGGGICFSDVATGAIYGGEIHDNSCQGCGAGIALCHTQDCSPNVTDHSKAQDTVAKLDFYGGKIYNNVTGGYNHSIDFHGEGGGIFVSWFTTLNVGGNASYTPEIFSNIATRSSTYGGGGIGSRGNGVINMKSGYIYSNKAVIGAGFHGRATVTFTSGNSVYLGKDPSGTVKPDRIINASGAEQKDGGYNGSYSGTPKYIYKKE